MTKQTILQKVSDYFCFKGNLNRFTFLLMILFAELIYNLIYDIAIYYYPTFQGYPLRSIRIYMGILFCYMYGIAIVGRLRNLKINPCFAYFFVLALWVLRFVLLNRYDFSRSTRIEYVVMLSIFLFLPLFAKDKKTLILGK